MGDATPLADSSESRTTPEDLSFVTKQHGGYESHASLHTGHPQKAMDEQAATITAPFHAQMDSIHLRGDPLNNHSSASAQQGIMMDMSALTNTLPEVSSVPTQYDGYYQQGVSLGGRELPTQSSMSAHYLHAQLPPMGVQHTPHFRHSQFSQHMSHSPAPGQASRLGPVYPMYGTYQPFASPMSMPNPVHSVMNMPGPYASYYGRPDMFPQMPPQQYPRQENRSFMPTQSLTAGSVLQAEDAGLPPHYSAPERTPSYPRGPPRKPKQSGHALWVGNLPPGTIVTDLKDHFSRDATRDIESLFLISKSNCAFVNYRTETACSAAMNRFHDSRFKGVRLVCRLRRGSTSTTAPATSTQVKEAPESPTKTDTPPNNDSGRRRSEVVIASGSNNGSAITEGAEQSGTKSQPVARVPEKYFIVKSLTLQDLDSSVRNGIWATQSHNEAALNEAFESAESVYLIFSANKSGEYFGYARMASPITGEAVAINSQPQRPEPEEVSTDGPKSIPTPATEWAPKGRIVDDSARGTIFWEADPVPGAIEATERVTGSRDQEQGDGSKQGQDWGKPFHIEWISTNRLPFYRTRGLRNPWNANREVKIARDGTELEPSIGKRLVQMFHRPMVVVPVTMPEGTAPMQQPFQPY